MISPVRAIRKHCIHCQGGSLKGVRLCEELNCVLRPFRMGANPNRQGIGGKSKIKRRLGEKTPRTNIPKAIRQQIKERDKGVCQLCNKKSGNLEMHHIDWSGNNHTLENLKSLCSKCHRAIHFYD